MMHFNDPDIINVIDCMIPENEDITTYQQVSCNVLNAIYISEICCYLYSNIK